MRITPRVCTSVLSFAVVAYMSFIDYPLNFMVKYSIGNSPGDIEVHSSVVSGFVILFTMYTFILTHILKY